ncbi:hypothetical protein BH20VER1_BH20VER1_24110 [soil metagenome]
MHVQGTRISGNDNWRSDDEAAIRSPGFPPSDDREAAARLTLAPGSYTAIVRGANATHGIALVELYKLAAE